MDIEDIKIGETYNVLMQIHDYVDGIIFCSTVIDIDTKDGVQCGEEYEICHDEISAFSPISTAPKYNPCRRFRMGDEVEYTPKEGRELYEAETLLGETLKVIRNEDEQYNRVEVKFPDGSCRSIPFYYLKLAIPVEEQEQYYIEEELGTITVLSKNDPTFHKCWHYGGVKSGGIALANAEAERDRLNAEHRKEQE